MKTPKSLFRAVLGALVGLAALVLGPETGRSQSCLRFSVIATFGQTNESVTAYAPYAPDTSSPKIFFTLTMSNYAHGIHNADYGVGQVPQFWNHTNHMDLTTEHSATNGQTGGSGTAYSVDYFDAVLSQHLSATYTFPTNSWVSTNGLIETRVIGCLYGPNSAWT